MQRNSTMSFSQLSPIPCTGIVYSNNHEDRFVPDLLAGELSPRAYCYPPSGKRGREDSGCYLSGGEEEAFLDCFTPDSKRHCNSVTSSILPNSPLALEYTTATSIPVTGSSPVNSVDFVHPASSNCSIDRCSVFQPSQCFTGDICENIEEVFASMQKQCEPVVAGELSQQFSKDYQLLVTEQPELFYRARYQTEGVRAPIKGRKENYPAVQVKGPEYNYGTIVVKLVHEDGSDHTSCSLDCSEERRHALSKKIGRHNRMATEFEDLRIRREKKKEGRKTAAASDKLNAKEGHNDKVACLLFVATLQTPQGPVKCQVKSEPISLTAAPEPAELDWMEPTRGHVSGGEFVVIKGSKMTSPKVTFRIYKDGQYHDIHGTVDKERSHQNVLLVRTPPLSQLGHFDGPTVPAKVQVVTGRSQMPSNTLDFEYIPNYICRECMQETPSTPRYPSGPGSSPSLQMGQPLYPPPPHSSTHDHPSPLPPSPPTSQEQPAYKLASHMSTKSMGHTSSLLQQQPEPLPHAFLVEGGGSTSDKSPPPPPPPPATDDLMHFMHDLMGGAEYPGSACSTGVSNQQQQQNIGSPFMLCGGGNTGFETQLQQSSPGPYLPEAAAVSSPQYLCDTASVHSPSTDTPLYSPVTPLQQNSPAAAWNHISQMLFSLKQSDRLSDNQYMMYQSECAQYSPLLLQAYNSSRSNEELFLQLLASIKPDDPQYQATHL